MIVGDRWSQRADRQIPTRKKPLPDTMPVLLVVPYDGWERKDFGKKHKEIHDNNINCWNQFISICWDMLYYVNISDDVSCTLRLIENFLNQEWVHGEEKNGREEWKMFPTCCLYKVKLNFQL